MDKTKISKYTISFGLSLAITSLVSAFLVVAKELCPNSVMLWIRHLTGQHWVSHSLIAVMLFAILAWTFSKASGGQGINLNASRLIGLLVGGVVLGAFIIAGFYLIGG
jgi:hypothetical protein